MTEIVNFDPVTKLGAPEDEAQKIKALFVPMFDKMEELEQEFNELISRAGDEPSKEVCDEAKLLKIKYKDVRKGTEKIHKEAKAYHLLMGRVADGWKNAQLAASGAKEEKLLNISKHYELKEAARKAELAASRGLELEKYETSGEHMDLENMSEDVWQNVLAGVRVQYNQRKEAEQKAEEERIENERKVELHKERRQELYKYAPFTNLDKVTLESSEEEFAEILALSKSQFDAEEKRKADIEEENERLKAEQDKAEAKRKKEEARFNSRTAKLQGVLLGPSLYTYEGETVITFEEIKTLSDAKFKALCDKHNKKVKADLEAKAKAEAEAQEAQAKKDQELAELKAKEEAEQAEQKAKEEEAEARKLEGDKAVLTFWVNSITSELPPLDQSNLNTDCQDAYADIRAKYASFKKWALKTVEELS